MKAPPNLERDFVPEKVAFSSHIGPKYEGQSLLAYLSDRFRYFNAEQWQLRIQEQDVYVNGAAVGAEQALKSGDEVRYMALTRPEPRVPRNIPVLFEDEDLLIVNKPPHIPVHPTGRYLRNTVVHLLQQQRGHKLLFLAHRIDRETSGVLVLTKTHLAKEKMYWAFFKGDLEKTYWALTWGKPSPPSGTVDAPIGLAKESRIRIKQAINGRDAKSARTKYHTLSTRLVQAPEWAPPPWPSLSRVQGGGAWPISLVECRPLTGRTNQIRVHMAHLGAGLVGDKLYDPDESVFIRFREDARDDLEDPKKPAKAKGHGLPAELERRLILDAHALHAKRLVFRHPRTGAKMQIDAPVPKSWQGLYNP